MQQSKSRLWVVAITATLTLAQLGNAADHGPVFGLATPTNPEGGWSLDLGVNGRGGTASTLEAELTYGITQNLQACRLRSRCVSTGRPHALVSDHEYTEQR